MGFHVCHICQRDKRETRYPITSSGDVRIDFGSGRSWVMPDMILHYVADHGWLPPASFVADVMSGVIASAGRRQTRGIQHIVEVHAAHRVGYLNGPVERQELPDGFVERLAEAVATASKAGSRVQTKGILR